MSSFIDSARACFSRSDLSKAEAFLESAVGIGDELLKSDARNSDWLRLQWTACWNMSDARARRGKIDDAKKWLGRTSALFAQMKEVGQVTAQDDKFEQRLEKQP